MQSEVDQISPVLVELKIAVPWDKVNEHLEEAYRSVQRKARVRGFRPGKVPRSVVKKMMGKSVEAEVTNALVQEGVGAAVEEHHLHPVAMTDVDTPEIAQGQPLTFKAKLEVRPKIETVETGGIAVERVKQSVTDEAVAAELDRLREQNAELVTPASPRPAAAGDTATIDLDVTVGGEPRPDLSSTDTRAELGVEGLLPEIEQGLLGLEVGGEREVSLTFPEDYGREDLAGKAATFTLKLKELQEKRLPQLDDEFAKDLEHDSLDALRADVRKKLEATAERRTQALLRESVVEALIDKNPIPVPPSMIQQQHRAMLQEFFQFSQMLGGPMNFDESMHEEFEAKAERKVRAGLLFGAIADQQKLEITEEDLEAKLGEIADQSGKHVAKVRAEYQGPRRDQLRTQLLEQKLLEYLLAQATITDVEGGAEAAGESKAEGAKKKATKKKATKKGADEDTKVASDAANEDALTKAPAKKKAAKKKTAKAKTDADE